MIYTFIYLFFSILLVDAFAHDVFSFISNLYLLPSIMLWSGLVFHMHIWLLSCLQPFNIISVVSIVTSVFLLQFSPLWSATFCYHVPSFLCHLSSSGSNHTRLFAILWIGSPVSCFLLFVDIKLFKILYKRDTQEIFNVWMCEWMNDIF